MAEPTLRLAILVCNTPTPQVREKYGTYTDMFRKWLRKSLQAMGSRNDFILNPYDVLQGQYPSNDKIHGPDPYHGVIITGSAADAFGTLPWIESLVKFIANLMSDAPSIKIIGVCFGHQIVSRAAGVQVVRNPLGWEAGTTRIQLTDEGKRVFGLDSGVMDIIEMHRDHVPAIPENFTLLGSTAHSQNQGMVKRYATSSQQWNAGEIHVLTLQGHPEFCPGNVNLSIDAREKSGVMDAEAVRTAREKANKPDDGIGPIGKAVFAVFGVTN